MAVAESQVATTTPSRPRDSNVGLASLAGGIVLLAVLGLVFSALPYAWGELLPPGVMNEFLSGALLLIVGIVAVVAACLVLAKLDRDFAAPGVRAGSFFAAASIFISAWIVIAIGNAMDRPGQESVGMFVTLLVAAAFLAGIAFVFTRKAFASWLVSVEEAGWFTNQGFKPNQGVRVRRATVLGLLVIGLSGVYAMTTHQVFGTTRAAGNDWSWTIPFTTVVDESTSTRTYLYVPLLSRVTVLGPIILSGLVFWFSWRLVNWPVFADFLIATEAEMNKVSWTSRKRLVADTIVVLVTVFLLTTFLFTVDIVWFKILSSPYVQVLHVDLKAEQAKQQEKTQW